MTEQRSVVGRIVSLYDNLTDSERRIADFILNDSRNVSSLNASEIAKLSGTSSASVSRFARSLGYDSLARLRFALARDEVGKEAPFNAIDSIVLDDVKGSVAYILDNKIEEIKDTFSTLDFNLIRKAAELISHAETVMFIGVGSSLSFSQTQAIKFSQVGVKAMSPATSEAGSALALRLGPQDCVVFISSSGTSRRLDVIMDNLTDTATPTIVISANAQSRLASRADVFLRAVIRDQLLAGNFLFSYNSMNAIIEVLLLLVMHSSEDSAEYVRIFNKSFSHDKDGVPPANIDAFRK